MIKLCLQDHVRLGDRSIAEYNGQYQIYMDGKPHQLGRWILGLHPDDPRVKFRNGDKRDLRRENLYVPTNEIRLIELPEGSYVERRTNKGTIIKLGLEDSNTLGSRSIMEQNGSIRIIIDGQQEQLSRWVLRLEVGSGGHSVKFYNGNRYDFRRSNLYVPDNGFRIVHSETGNTYAERTGSRNNIFKLDTDDNERLGDRPITESSDGSGRLNDGGKTVKLHRWVLGYGPEDPEVDHINQDTRDARKSNLRPATHSQNSMNRKKNPNATSSKYKGVYQNYSKWYMEIWIERDAYREYGFETELEAAIAYNRKAVELHGEFASLNPIPN